MFTMECNDEVLTITAERLVHEIPSSLLKVGTRLRVWMEFADEHGVVVEVEDVERL